MKRPSHSPPDDEWQHSRVLAASRAATFQTRFPHLLLETELWLPAEFDFVFTAAPPVGDPVRFGSGVRLRDELATICRESWGGDAEAISRWRRENVKKGAPLEEGARFCCALMLELAEAAVQHKLPMKLDY